MKYEENLSRLNFVAPKVTGNIVLFDCSFFAEVVIQKLFTNLLLQKCCVIVSRRIKNIISEVFYKNSDKN
jgi:hypothetical protein